MYLPTDKRDLTFQSQEAAKRNSWLLYLNLLKSNADWGLQNTCTVDYPGAVASHDKDTIKYLFGKVA